MLLGLLASITMASVQRICIRSFSNGTYHHFPLNLDADLRAVVL